MPISLPSRPHSAKLDFLHLLYVRSAPERENLRLGLPQMDSVVAI
jgi:hypothetical protein